MNRTVPSTGPLQDVAGRLRWQTCIAPVHTGTGKFIFYDEIRLRASQRHGGAGRLF